MTEEQKIDLVLEKIEAMQKQLDEQDKQLEYIVARLNHMRDKAHEQRESEVRFPK